MEPASGAMAARGSISRGERWRDASEVLDTPDVMAGLLSQRAERARRFERLWRYYRNELRPVRLSDGRWYEQGQELGLPTRVLGGRRTAPGTAGEVVPRREVVIENDIAWRVQLMVDFLFGKPVAIESTARDARTRALVNAVLARVWEASGGIALLHEWATMAHVFGHADLLLRGEVASLRGLGARLGVRVGAGIEGAALDGLLEACEGLRIEAVDPRLGAALLDERDYRRIRAYVVAAQTEAWGTAGGGAGGGAAREGWWEALVGRVLAGRAGGEGAGGEGSGPGRRELVEMVTPDRWTLRADGSVVWQQDEALTPGAVPVVHVQNSSLPNSYEGLGEVEPLIPLQDELNTRLSDRAHRVTLQSFKMYLAKGVEGFEKLGVAPGVVWYTDNPDASVTAFGGDGQNPSEDEHVREVREALDKVSGVPPVAGGVVQARIGNLSSATALRITLLGLLAKTNRKRVAFGQAMTQMCGLVLHALDHAGLVRTEVGERGVRIVWQDPLPQE